LLVDLPHEPCALPDPAWITISLLKTPFSLHALSLHSAPALSQIVPDFEIADETARDRLALADHRLLLSQVDCHLR